jgi:hypothetical protein
MNSEPLDERTAAFVRAVINLDRAIINGEEMKDRSMILRGVSHVVFSLLQTMQYPRDQGLIAGLTSLNLLLTQFQDDVVLNAGPDDPRLQALRERAELEPAWPTLARPRDPGFVNSKLEKLHVGERAIGSLSKNIKRPPSLATARNRLTLKLVQRIERDAKAVLQMSREDGAIKSSSLPVAEDPQLEKLEKQMTQMLQLSYEAIDCPFVAKNLKRWTRLLTELVLIIDPKLEQFPELKQVRFAAGPKFVKSEEAKFRSGLGKFFSEALKNLLS